MGRTSHNLANANRQQLERHRDRDGVTYRPPQPERVDPPLAVSPGPAEVRAYPSLLIASIQPKHNLARPMAVYLLMRAHDADGSGYLDAAEIRELLTDPASDWYIYGKRAHRKTMAAGDGILWDRHTDSHIWLRSPPRVAVALGVPRLEGLPVMLPIAALLGSIGDVRAHFATSYESGRKGNTPISRAALEKRTGIPQRTQAAYDKRLGRKRRTNIVVLDDYWRPGETWQAWPGRAVFRYVDWTGRMGKKFASRVAYRIADDRSRAHWTAPKGRLGKLNRWIANVVKTPVETRRKRNSESKVAYRSSAADAAAAYNRDPSREYRYHMFGDVQHNVTKETVFEGVGIYGAVIPS